MAAVRTLAISNAIRESFGVGDLRHLEESQHLLPIINMTPPEDKRETTKVSSSEEQMNPLASHTNPKSKPGVTYASQDQLEKLPIPDLNSSAKKYLQSLRPLQTSKEHHESERAVNEFLATSGPELQEELRQYASERMNYIEQFWYDSYLNFDNPVVLNLNPFFLLEDDPTPARSNQVTRAASLVVSALAFVRAVRKEELPPDTIRGQPLDMFQYSRLFGVSRIPTENGCQIVQDPAAKHIVVLCHGQFYWFDVLDDNSDLIMSEKDIALNLDVIIDDAKDVPVQEAAKGALGVLSTENRKTWSGLRDILHREENSNNSDCLNIVDHALFVLCLDYTKPKTSAELCMNMLCGSSKVERGVQVGTCTNRWYDKLQIIVCKNGSAGINFEHTGVDGHTVLRFASDVYTDTILRYARTINGQAPSLWASTSPDPSKRDPSSFGDVITTPRKLEWDMVPELSTALRFAETRLADLIQQNEFQTLDFMSYGKNFITSMGFSPDAFVQMAFQAAYYGLYGRIECVYEPAMTKAFYHGRTEAIRSVTTDSVDFVKTFWGENPGEKKVEALRRACQTHTAVTKEASKGQGHDRHLYALYCIWQRQVDSDLDNSAARNESNSPRDASPASPSSHRRTSSRPSSPAYHLTHPQAQQQQQQQQRQHSNSNASGPHHHHDPSALPSIFADPGWDTLSSTILSTSNCGNPSLRQFGFGPTSPEGFGIGYIIKDGSISICASSKHRQTRRFVDAIESYFLEARRLLRGVARQQQNSNPATSTNTSIMNASSDSKVTNSQGAHGAEMAGHLRATAGGVKDKNASRAREAERKDDETQAPPAVPRTNTSITNRRGRAIGAGAESSTAAATNATSATTLDVAAVDDDDDEEEGLGGYGFFDAGMLFSALRGGGGRASSKKRDSSKAGSPKTAAAASPARTPLSSGSGLGAAANSKIEGSGEQDTSTRRSRRSVGRRLKLNEY